MAPRDPILCSLRVLWKNYHSHNALQPTHNKLIRWHGGSRVGKEIPALFFLFLLSNLFLPFGKFRNREKCVQECRKGWQGDMKMRQGKQGILLLLLGFILNYRRTKRLVKSAFPFQVSWASDFFGPDFRELSLHLYLQYRQVESLIGREQEPHPSKCWLHHKQPLI